ncbi:GNAT family N-acetyltransferase [Halobacillus sp. BAB-2008]|uniref:GNAT family N-acetyltransferase n=1 Tax=Halobacillus sp. BAB-2008 TaxID=1246484 RepID=UPI0002A4E93F|nr:GNAT family N-acetyltransferase [Halobacillus sp. BAB-2008]ELK46013.1 acetyltransferase [Halobacillus sp. BAB-2008]
MDQYQTERLTMMVFTLDMMNAALESNTRLKEASGCEVPENYPMELYKQMLPYKIERFHEYPEENLWEGLIIHTESNTIIGDMGFKGGPDENGEMDIGYSILPEYRGNGYASEMASSIVRWGLKQPGVKKITASCSTGNQASIRVLEKAGFQRTGESDGEWYWQLEA